MAIICINVIICINDIICINAIIWINEIIYINDASFTLMTLRGVETWGFHESLSYNKRITS
jgi:hypothetical protein